jgi:hypothetical protein
MAPIIKINYTMNRDPNIQGGGGAVLEDEKVNETALAPDKKIINCHTHIFTGDHVPPFLAKTYIPLVYWVFSLRWIGSLFHWWYNGPLTTDKHTPKGKSRARTRYNFKMFIQRHLVLRFLVTLLGIALFVYTFYFAWSLLGDTKTEKDFAGRINQLRLYANKDGKWLPVENIWLNIFISLMFIVLFKSGRNLLLFILKKTTKFFGILPGPMTKELFRRYANIGRFAFRKTQSATLTNLCNQYPPDTQFVVLPMDMDYMDAGMPRGGYLEQMDELAKIKESGVRKDQLLPFIFTDPRRIENNPTFFSYQIGKEGEVVLADCFIKKYLEKGFCGFKIYPALGYYPFDERLLPLWKFAADNQIPVMTHCIKGTIFYRGSKKKIWDNHPVFEQMMEAGKKEPLLLSQTKNVEFSVNFTHPLNYLCILNKELLQGIVSKSTDSNLHKVFGYDAAAGTMKHDLSHFKICLGHFGGDDEWIRYMENDRDKYSPMIVNKPDHGVDFFNDTNGNPAPGQLELVWKGADWYTIICSLMLQYKGVYGDLSYILHDIPHIFPLLKLTMQNQTLKTRVLYGTDFYVVRNHNSDKSLLAGTLDALTKTEFDLVARTNPEAYLNNAL